MQVTMDPAVVEFEFEELVTKSLDDLSISMSCTGCSCCNAGGCNGCKGCGKKGGDQQQAL
ncbi:MAG: hypothetical protein GX542_03990 [Rhodococcus sp.]|nr:hypothetical protein [Rhodococcus sp. (in: high G+C Gram-positive bacteria)]